MDDGLAKLKGLLRELVILWGSLMALLMENY